MAHYLCIFVRPGQNSNSMNRISRRLNSCPEAQIEIRIPGIVKDFQFYLLCMSHIIKVAVNVYKAPYEQHMPLRHGIYVMALIVIIMLE